MLTCEAAQRIGAADAHSLRGYVNIHLLVDADTRGLLRAMTYDRLNANP